MSNDCVLVLGMHRSGTSAVAKYIHELGFALPGKPMPAHETDNPLGYFEPEELVKLNNGVLKELGESWNTFNHIPSNSFDSPAISPLAAQITETLTAAVSRHQRLVIKDPRICRLLPLWMPIVDDLFDNVVIVKVIRQPDEVARSLAYRANRSDTAPAAITDSHHAMAMWLRYNVDIARFDFGHPSIRLDFNRWHQENRREGKRLGAFLREHFSIKHLPSPRPDNHSPRQSGQKTEEKSSFSDELCQRIFKNLHQAEYSKDFLFTLNDVSTVIPAQHQQESPHPGIELLAEGHIKQHARLANLTDITRPRWFQRRSSAAHQVLYLSQNCRPRSHIYRVINMIEGLSLGNSTAAWMYPSDALKLQALSTQPRSILLQRCEWNDEIEKLINLARNKGIPVGADMDDLLFDDTLIEQGYFRFANKDEALRAEWVDRARSFRKVMENADYCLATTKTLAKAASDINTNTFLVPNGYSAINLKIANHWRTHPPRARDGRPRIGYASGTPTHDDDFFTVIKPLKTFLSNNPDWVLSIIGPLDRELLTREIADTQLEFRPVVDHINFAYELARLDINLVPLENTLFCEAKSPLKWYESALAGTPSIAFNNATYKDYIEDGQHAMLAGTDEEWLTCINKLASSESLREQLVTNAVPNIVSSLSSQSIAQNLLQQLESRGW